MGLCCFGFCVEEEEEEKVIVNKIEVMNMLKVRLLRCFRVILRIRLKVRLKGYRDKKDIVKCYKLII